MYQAKSKVKAEKALKYVAMLSHHFGRKATVDISDEGSKVHFPMGHCVMSAEEGELKFLCEAESDDALQAVQSIIDNHMPLLKHIKDTELEWSYTTI